MRFFYLPAEDCTGTFNQIGAEVFHRLRFMALVGTVLVVSLLECAFSIRRIPYAGLSEWI
jgi:hypothetical protein